MTELELWVFCCCCCCFSPNNTLFTSTFAGLTSPAAEVKNPKGLFFFFLSFSKETENRRDTTPVPSAICGSRTGTAQVKHVVLSRTQSKYRLHADRNDCNVPVPACENAAIF